jgi:hypothetical protein
LADTAKGFSSSAQEMMMDISKIPLFWLKNSLKAWTKNVEQIRRDSISPP